MRKWLVFSLVVLGLGAPVRSDACPCGDQKRPAQGKAARARVTLALDGMTCASCGAAIRVTLKKLDGVQDATVSFDDKRADVTYDPSRVTPEKMIKAIEDAGYQARVEKGKA